MKDALVVRSHVGRDLLQSAAVFRNEKAVIWEYVSNGLQYVDPGTSPEVRVRIDDRKKRISIADNGRGMNWADLTNFFIMHGENVDRKAGRMGRGMFGTGKSAAFGIADCLRVTSIRGGKRSVVELSRVQIEKVESGEEVPVNMVEREVRTDQSNGTLVEIEGVHLNKIDQAAVIQYIERHIARWPDATVFINNHQCEYVEPAVDRVFELSPQTEEQKQVLGDARLVLKVSKSKLDEDTRGVAILSNGVWYETTLAGCERREMAEYIFGEVNVPALTTDKSKVSAFDMSRSMQLNRSNNLVMVLFGFLGAQIEAVRRALVEEERKRRQTAEAKRLAREADQISKLINEDFSSHITRLRAVQSRGKGKRDLLSQLAEHETDERLLTEGGDVPGNPVEDAGSGPPPGPGPRPGPDDPPTDPIRLLEPEPSADEEKGSQGQAKRKAEQRGRRFLGAFSGDWGC